MAIRLKNNVDRDQWQILAEYTDDTTCRQWFTYGNYIDEVLVMNDGADDTYYAHDHLYSPAALLDDTGAVVERYEYDAYGKVQILTSNFSPLTSSQHGTLHHMHYRHRDYSPQLGRFMQHDPLGINPERSKFFIAFDYQSYGFLVELLENRDSERGVSYYWPNAQYLNGNSLFGYSLNNPISHVDPFGKYIGIAKIKDENKKEKLKQSPYGTCGAIKDVLSENGRFAGKSGNFKHCYLSCMMTKDPLVGPAATLCTGVLFECASNFQFGDIVADSLGVAIGSLGFLVDCASACDRLAPSDDWWGNPPPIPGW